MSSSAVVLEAHPPTAVTHCESAYLTHSPCASSGTRHSLPNLVTVRNRYIDVYWVCPDTHGHSAKLELVVTQRLYGEVESLSTLKLKGAESGVHSGRDALLLTFRDAKLSVLSWDDSIMDLTPSSLHYFESDVSLKMGRECFPMPPFAVTDPEGRSAAVIMFRHQTAFLPTASSTEFDTFGIVDDGDDANIESRRNACAAVGNSYVDNLGKLGVRDIRDAVFLHGTSEPTLLCLHEMDPTWVGNLGEKKDTCCLTALSVNTSEKRHSKVWEALEVPSDATKLVSVPQGGALVFTSMAILYYNQGYKTGVIMNSKAIPSTANPPPLTFDLSVETPCKTAESFAERYGMQIWPKLASSCVAFCDTKFSDWNLECSGSFVMWLSKSDGLLLLRSGHILQISIQTEAGGRKLSLSKVAGGPQPCSATVLSDSLVFIGSRGGDGLLISCTRESADIEEAQPSKKIKKDPKDGQVEDLEDYLDDQMLYQDFADTISVRELNVQVCDCISNIGTMRSLITLPSIDGSNHNDYMACCGTGHGGNLVILNPRLCPDTITEVPLPGIRGAWAVGTGPHGEGRKSDSYLLLTFENETKILTSGNDLKEVSKDVDFATDSKTLTAGTVSGHDVQVTSTKILVLRDGKLLETVRPEDLMQDTEKGRIITSARISGQYILIETSDQSAYVLELKTGAIALAFTVPNTIEEVYLHIVSTCVYKDDNGWLKNILEPERKRSGDFVVASYSNGEVMIWSMDGSRKNAKPLWRSKNISSGADVIASDFASLPTEAPDNNASIVVELRLHHIKSGADAPYLVAITDTGNLLCYLTFVDEASKGPPRLKMKRKHVNVPCGLFTQNQKMQGIFPFEEMGEFARYNGFFVCGTVPFWLIISKTGVYAHMSAAPLDTATLGFTQFDNSNCPRGFIAVRENGSLLIGNLPPHRRLDMPWPRRKLAINAIPFASTYYPEAKLVALLVANLSRHRPFLPDEGESEPQAAYAYALAAQEASALEYNSKYEVRLFDPFTWKMVWKHGLLPGESGLTVEALHLKDMTTGATVPMIVVGTAFSAGEDYPCSGRVLLFEVKKSEESSAFQGRLVYAREFKGPVSGLSAVEGYLLLSTGNRIETCLLKSSQLQHDAEIGYTLQRSAFFEGPSLVTSLNVVKNFVLLGDVQHGCTFLRYKDQGKQLMLLSKDFGKANVKASQFLIAGSSLSFLSADGEGNFWAFSYAPNDPKCWKGQKLKLWGSIHVGKGASCMLRTHIANPRMHRNDNRGLELLLRGEYHTKQGILCGTNVGSIHLVLPLKSEEAQECDDRIRKISCAMTTTIAHACGLNPSAFRRRYQKTQLSMEGAEPYDPPNPLYSQGLLDGQILLEYLDQSAGGQARIASISGISRDELSTISNLLRLTIY